MYPFSLSTVQRFQSDLINQFRKKIENQEIDFEKFNRREENYKEKIYLIGEDESLVGVAND